MTPQLQQAIKLLQMSNADLQTYIDAELERNPLLERADDPGDEPVSEPERGEPESDDAGPTAEHDDASPADYPASARTPTDSGWQSVQGSGARMEDANDLESIVASETSLSDHLHRQLAIATTDPAERLIGSYLIGSLNEAGYLTASVESLAESLGTSAERIEEVLQKLQKFEPSGVFARDLRECLAIQLREQDRLDPAMAKLLDNLHLVARRDLLALADVCGVEPDDLKEMLAELRSLSPKPGAVFSRLIIQPVIPDVIVRAAPDGTWLVELNSDSLPRVLVNNHYYTTVSRNPLSDEDRTFVSNCHSTASWLVKSLDQRARTILTVSKEIVRQQDAFLMHGVQHLRPMNLRVVAQAIGMHESTVSRVTSNKYLATPRGIFEMKYFFTTAIAATDGEAVVSAEAVRARIKVMVDNEGSEVLSDDAIVDMLRADGIEIARRTVAKYRESMGILSSVQRRRERKLYG